ncbi:MAG: hypothetical protein QNJ58_13465 [Desulfobacterales bacterium]|nr:hypothetical protein [Desulfobacterales bacterium]
MRRIVTLGIILGILGLVCPAASGEEAKSEKNWEFELSPMYLWAVSTKGDVTVKGVQKDFDLSFSDIFDDLNGAVTFHFEAVRKQEWGLFTDLNYIELNPDDKNTDINFRQVLAEAAAFYRLEEQGVTIDGFGGLRYSSMYIELELPNAKDIDQRKDWLDPFLGLRWGWNFSDRWRGRLRGDVGGFGIGSQIAYNGVGVVDFKPWKHVSLFGGYRVLFQKYSTGNRGNRFKYDGYMHGPLLGLNIYF